MFTAFSTALSALSADSTAIDVVGNNLANLNTTGFKASDVQFHDLISQSIGGISQSNQVGMGVGQINAVKNFTQGAIQNTGGATDAAIEGSGFFVVKDAANTQLFTRDGAFKLDANGNIVTQTGQNVQGWNADLTTGTLSTNGPVSNLTIPLTTTIPARATTTMSMGINLDASSPVNTSTDAKNPTAGSQFSAPIQVYDSLGVAHTLTVTFTHGGLPGSATANPLQWDYSVTIPDADVKTPPATALATGTLTFDGTGNLPSANTTPPGTPIPDISLTIPALADAASEPTKVSWSLYDKSGNPTVTQFAEASGLSNPVQDGYAAGQITKVSFQDGGLVVANFSNGQQLTVGQLALASITNPDSLIDVGNNNLQASAATAQAAIGTANSGTRGQIAGGSLESSTTDIATEFTNLLTFQRSYQAASRVITTSDQLLQETVNLIHP